MHQQPRFFRSLRILLAIVIHATFLTSCGAVNWTCGQFGGTMDITAVVQEYANGNTPIAVDVVMAFDEGLVNKLSGMSAREWFNNKSQILRDYPDGVELYEREWVPEYGEYVIPVHLRGSAVAGFLFANYATEGEHRERLSLYDDITVTLGPDDFTVTR